MSVADPETANVRQCIEALNAEFAWLIDEQAGRGVPELFTEDGVYAMPNQTYSGRSQIAEFYGVRKARGQRAARHVFTNLRLKVESPDRATGTVILTLYAYDGAPPYPAVPILIADYNDIYVRAQDGHWRYQSRTLIPVFGQMPDLGKRPSHSPQEP